jgi:hypothetical protein
VMTMPASAGRRLPCKATACRPSVTCEGGLAIPARSVVCAPLPFVHAAVPLLPTAASTAAHCWLCTQSKLAGPHTTATAQQHIQQNTWAYSILYVASGWCHQPNQQVSGARLLPCLPDVDAECNSFDIYLRLSLDKILHGLPACFLFQSQMCQRSHLHGSIGSTNILH